MEEEGGRGGRGGPLSHGLGDFLPDQSFLGGPSSKEVELYSVNRCDWHIWRTMTRELYRIIIDHVRSMTEGGNVISRVCLLSHPQGR